MSEMNFSAKWYKLEEIECAPHGTYWLYENCYDATTGTVGMNKRGELCLWDCEGNCTYKLGWKIGTYYKGVRIYGPIFPPEYPKD